MSESSYQEVYALRDEVRELKRKLRIAKECLMEYVENSNVPKHAIRALHEMYNDAEEDLP